MAKNLNTIDYWNKVYQSEYSGKTYKKDHKMSSKNYCRNYEEVFEKIIEMIPDESKVLDVACGPGIFCRNLKKRKPNTKITGIDFSDFIINLNKKRDKNLGIKYFQCDIRKKLPFKSGTKFDVISMSEIIEHLEKPEKVVSRFMRYLKKGGLFFISCPHGDYWKNVMKKEGTIDEHVRSWDHDELFHLLVKYGPSVTFIRPKTTPWYIIAYIRKF